MRLYRKNSKPLFNNILLTLTLTLTITILFVSIILYANFEKIGLSIVYSSSRDSLEQASYSIDLMEQSAKNIALQIYYDPEMAKLLFYKTVTSSEINSSLKHLLVYRNPISSFLNSIYIYNAERQTFYLSVTSTQNQIQTRDSFFDKDIVNILDNLTLYERFSFIPRQLLYTINKSNHCFDVYTYLFYEFSDASRLQNAVILNISESWINNILESLNTNPLSNTFIIDSSGIMVTNDKNYKMSQDVSRLPYINTIINTYVKSGYFIDSVNNIKSLITYEKSESPDWIFVRVVPYTSVIKDIHQMKVFTIISVIIILIIGLSISYLVSKRLYKPINKILYDFSMLRREKYKNLSSMRQDFLKNILSGYLTDKSEFEKKITEFEITLNPDEEFILMLIRIDFYAVFCNKYNMEDRTIFRFAIANIATELCSEYSKTESIDMNDDSIIILMNYTSKYDGSTIKRLASNIQSAVLKHLDISLTITVNNEKSDLNRISVSYSQTISASEYRIYRGHYSFISVNDIKNYKTDNYVYPIELEKKMLEMLSIGKVQESKKIYDSIINKTMEYSFNILNIAILRLSSSINPVVEAIKKNNNMPFYDYNKFLKELNNDETMYEINEHFHNLFDSISQILKDKKIHRHTDLVNKIINIIHEEYTDPNLSLVSIADKVNLSPVYLGRIFKSHTSESINDYINEVRTDYAKKLLTNTSMSFSDIINSVGVTNKSYFYTVFKKITGLTPAEYRKKDT